MRPHCLAHVARTLAALAATLLLAATVQAQDPVAAASATNTKQKATAATVVEGTKVSLGGRTGAAQGFLSAAPVDGALVGPAVRGFLQADNGKSTATVGAGFQVVNQPGLDLSLRLEGKTPLSEGADDATLLDYRQLGDGTTVSLTLQGMRFGKSRTAPRPSALIEWCKSRKKEGRLDEQVDCSDFTSADLDDAPRALYLDFLRTAGWREPFTFEVSTRAQRNDYAYLDRATFASGNHDRVAYGAGGNLGRSFTAVGPLTSGLLAVGYDYSLKYQQGDSTNVCVPGGPAGGLTCRSGRLGAPNRRLTSAATAELRSFVGTKFAFSAQAAYLTRDKEWELSLPIYFLPSAEGALIGGLSPSYATDGKEWGVRLFVGATGFALFGKQ